MSRKSLFIFTAIFLLFLSWIGFRVRQYHLLRNEIISRVGKLEKIELDQDNKELIVYVFAPGPAEGQYRLKLEVLGDSIVLEKLFEVSQDVMLRYPKQIFTFKFPFNDLSRIYREKLESYQKLENKQLIFEEYLNIKATLIPTVYGKYHEKDLAAMKIPPGFTRALAQFYFACQNQWCMVYQGDPADLEKLPQIAPETKK